MPLRELNDKAAVALVTLCCIINIHVKCIIHAYKVQRLCNLEVSLGIGGSTKIAKLRTRNLCATFRIRDDYPNTKILSPCGLENGVNLPTSGFVTRIPVLNSRLRNANVALVLWRLVFETVRRAMTFLSLRHSFASG